MFSIARDTKGAMPDITSHSLDWHDIPLIARSQLTACPQGCDKSHASSYVRTFSGLCDERSNMQLGFRALGSANSGQLSAPLQCKLPSSHRCKYIILSNAYIHSMLR